MAKATQKYFCEKFDGTETTNIQPSESFPIYGNRLWEDGIVSLSLLCYTLMEKQLYGMFHLSYFSLMSEQLSRNSLFFFGYATCAYSSVTPCACFYIGHKNFHNCFYLELAIFLKVQKHCTLITKTLIRNLKALICRWTNKQWLSQNSASGMHLIFFQTPSITNLHSLQS